jgi:predicted RND superfamily exporter protein
MLRRSAWTIWVTVLLTIVFLLQIRNLQFDTSPSTLILSGSTEAAYYEEITRIFGNDQIILIGMQGEELLTPKELGQLRELTSALETIQGVKRVLSLTNVQDVRGTGDEVLVSPLVPTDLGALDIQVLRDRLKNNPFYERNLISSDGRTLAILVFLEDFDKKDRLIQGRAASRQVRSIAQNTLGQDRVFISGLPEMELQGTENMMRDLRIFTPVTLILVVVILAASFRCLRGVFLPLGVIGIAVIWTIAAIVWSGRPLKVTTLILPSLLISNGTSYVIHFLAQYYRLLAKAYDGSRELIHGKLDRKTYRQALLDALSFTHSPIFISAATTMAGFAAFIFSRIPAIRDLGIFATLGVFLSYLLCILLVPSVLWFLPVPHCKKLPGKEESHRHAFLEWLARFNWQHAGWIYALSMAAAGWALWGLLHIQVRSDYLAYFHQRSPVVQAAKFFHERLAGIAPLFVVVESQGERKVTDPAILNAIDALQQALNRMGGIDATLSFVDTLKLLNRAFHNEAPEQFTVPQEPDVVNDLIEFAESDPSGLSGDFLSSDHRHTRIVARTHLFSSSDLHETIDLIRKRAAALFPSDIRVQVTGSLVLMNRSSDQVAAEQSKSLMFSVLLIFAIVSVLFRSWKMGFLAIIPAGLPVFLCFGLMGWYGVSLNVNTSLIANIAIGIAVNNCVHYLVHFQRNLRRGLSVPDSSSESLKNAGAAMMAASIALTLGFLVFGFSSFVPVSQFGVLTAFIMGTDLLANILLLPSLMRLFKSPVTDPIPIVAK